MAEQREALIIRTDEESELERITSDCVQAVICTPTPLPRWMDELAIAVQTGALHIPRVTLHAIDRASLDRWFEQTIPHDVPSVQTRNHLKQDLLRLVDRLAAASGGSRFMLRVFTESPTTECGFHVDSVPAGAPQWGFLRVYNGAGTAYVEPANLTSMADFYRYLARRERLERERRIARRAGDIASCARLEQEVMELDAHPCFLKRPQEICIAPAGAIVAFKHISIADHWSFRSESLPWIHCSPMEGEARLVVNVTTTEPMHRSAPRATAARGG